MGMWPFRRKSNRQQSRGGAESADIPRSEEETMHHAATLGGPGTGRQPTEMTEMTSLGPGRRRSRRDSRKIRKSSRESKKLQRNAEKQRANSSSPGRHENIQLPRDAHRQHPVPLLPANIKTGGIKANTGSEPIATAVGMQPPRVSTQPIMSTEDWPRVPTLHKRSAADLNRRKPSKKRRKEEHDREAEIKAMVSMVPTRPATDSSGSGRPMKREIKKMRMGLNHSLHNPSSDISLPTAESMYSSLSSKSTDSTSYKISTLDILAPRPTIRYSESPRYVPGASGFGPDGSDSRKRRTSDRIQIPQEKLKANKRVDDLADELDAGDLRELMERDQRRREKKKIADKVKMEKRLARRQEKQKAEEAEAVRNGTPPPANMERGVLGREMVGLGIGNSAVITSSKRKGSDASSNNGRGKRSADAFRQASVASANDSHDHFQRSDSLATGAQSPASEREEPVIGKARIVKVSKANVSLPPSSKAHTMGTSSISQIMDSNEIQTTPPAKPEPERRTSESPVRPPQSWTSFFKRSSKTLKRRSIPSSFSNTSRDSMQRESFTSVPLPPVTYTPVKLASNVPKRTMSKFREDLPELPLSPPDSRVQSPEVDEVPPIRTDYPKTGRGCSTDNADPRVRYDTPTSGYQSMDGMRLRDETPTSGHRSVDNTSPEPTAVMSQSLASIDSEGSWLSGRRGGSKRGSTQIMALPLHDSASSLQRRYNELSESAEELGIAEDEYFSRLTPGPEDQLKIRRRSAQSGGQPVPSSDEEVEDDVRPTSPETKWGAVARHPTVVHHEPRIKSRQGLLNEYAEETSSELTGGATEELCW